MAGAVAGRFGDGVCGGLRRVFSDNRLLGGLCCGDGTDCDSRNAAFWLFPSLATGTVAIGGTLGSLIPPSVLFILYGIFAEQSIARLFVAAIIPGLISLLAYMLVIYIWVKLRPSAAPLPNETITKQERRQALLDCWAILTLFVVVVGGIYLGLFTPTEAAGIGAAATLVLGFVLRRLNLAKMLSALKESVYQTSMIFVIAIGGKLFVNFIALTGLANEITSLD